MVEHRTDRVSISAPIIIIGLTEEAASFKTSANWVSTAPGNTVLMQMIKDDRQIGGVIRTPGQTSHDELLIIT
ncbi:hypothetical protein D3C80_979170 [compost metagenome]